MGPDKERPKKIEDRINAPKEDPRANIYVIGLEVRMKSKGISLDDAAEEAKAEIERSKDTDPQGYPGQLSSLKAAVEYLKSVENK